ncbi:MAG: WXG100 family type VII secretion target [Anaerolineae bacterium]|nr:WXG100 family type VII secretion target [Anaerolineae bacterium]MCA9890164.1 WXG100 family type VII secretion target [Anaerolineae bacterium]MCA9891678.1 WXG100 family type VII secretion target [Anaerolineae bacterium]
MSNTIEVEYSQLRDCVRHFQREQDHAQHICNEIQAQLDVLKGGAWVADAADAFYREMEDDVLMGMRRLITALGRSSEVSSQITQIMEAAEQEASDMIPSS